MSDDQDSAQPPVRTPGSGLHDNPALLALFHAGDPVVVAAVIADHAPIAATAIGHIESDPCEANDILQDTVVTLVEKREQYRGDAPYAHYVVRVARNKAFSALRRRKSHRTDPLGHEPVDAVPSSEEVAVELEEQQARLRDLRALAAFRADLPDDLRTVLDLYYGEDMGRPRIIRETGYGDKAVRGKIKRLESRLDVWKSRKERS
jgi:RNA polymerase sigma-70 factor, ECF subfamily